MKTSMKKALTVRATRLSSNHNEVVGAQNVEDRRPFKKVLAMRATKLAANHNEVVIR